MMGAAIFTADQRAGAMHGKQFLLDSVYAGIDGTFVYGGWILPVRCRRWPLIWW